MESILPLTNHVLEENASNSPTSIDGWTFKVQLPYGAKVNLCSTKIIITDQEPMMIRLPVVIGISMNPSQDPSDFWIKKSIDNKIRCQVILKKNTGEIYSKYYEINGMRIGISGKFGFTGEFYEPSEELLESRMTLIRRAENNSQLTTAQKEIFLNSIVSHG